MPRKYERKTREPSRAGRPPIDDAPVARGVLLAVEGMGNDRRRAIRSAATVLAERRTTSGQPITLPRNAVQRVREAVDGLIAAFDQQSATCAPASILDLEAIGRHLRRTRSPDEFAKIIALWAVEHVLAGYPPWVTELVERNAELRRRLTDSALAYAREQVPQEFVATPS